MPQVDLRIAVAAGFAAACLALAPAPAPAQAALFAEEAIEQEMAIESEKSRLEYLIQLQENARKAQILAQ